MFKNGETTLKRVMVCGYNSLDIFTKIDFVKDLLRKNIGELSDRALQIAICHGWYYKLGRYEQLTAQEFMTI